MIAWVFEDFANFGLTERCRHRLMPRAKKRVRSGARRAAPEPRQGDTPCPAVNVPTYQTSPASNSATAPVPPQETA